MALAASAALVWGRFEHEHKLFARQTSGLILLQEGDLAQSHDELEAAQLALSEFLPIIKDEPRLELLRARIAEKRKQIGDQLSALQREQSKQNRIQAARNQLEKFRTLRNQAQLYAARFMVVDPAEHRKALRTTVLAALELFGQKPQTAAPPRASPRPLPKRSARRSRTRSKAAVTTCS